MVNPSESDQLQIDVDRGPNWLFVKLQPGKQSRIDTPQIADQLWSISAKHFIYRVVLELDELETVPEGMMGQIALLQQRLARHGGSLKVCGLSPQCEEVLHESHLDKVLPNHHSREDAVLGDSVLA